MATEVLRPHVPTGLCLAGGSAELEGRASLTLAASSSTDHWLRLSLLLGASCPRSYTAVHGDLQLGMATDETQAPEPKPWSSDVIYPRHSVGQGVSKSTQLRGAGRSRSNSKWN